MTDEEREATQATALAKVLACETHEELAELLWTTPRGAERFWIKNFAFARIYGT